ncbi:dienelactone hydrolase [Kineococcus xinjiangensis]|uniref:Dienelactone hydrolase n=1 Tax=Kineococcus xinjiangensis TaxID=512762 RepID=A0A2S6IDD1_9ACTN|nr:dienelactone hydrolase family protein [Kineococcus xinjiangensis]PPK92207.1 dienelactone hydrolase [Kineococcus xinjiangensis]
MVEVLLFHHVQGLTAGVRAFADDVRAAGHVVHAPDLFEGRTFGTIDEGMAHARELGDAVHERAGSVAAGLPESLVYAGFSMGGGIAQRLAQTRPGARGALLYETCYPITGEWAFGPWPEGVPAQVHGMGADPFFAEEEGDVDAARQLVAAHPDLAELHLYRGDRHLFADRSLPSHDPEAAALLLERTLAFLDRVSRRLPASAHAAPQTGS